MASDHHINIFFESKALDKETFKVVRFEGEEEISRPYRFVVDLVSDDPDVDLDATLGRPACLSFQRGDDGPLRKIHGVLSDIELGREGQHGHYSYRAVLVPRLWMMSLTQQNQIYQNKTIPEIVEEELKGSKGKGPAGNSTFDFAADDFEFRLSGSYPQKEYLVQYAESDLDFISRLLEQVGIYYFFEQGEDRERIVFCDANVHLPHVPGESSFPYALPSGTSSSMAESVQFLSSRRSQITDKVLLKDYNYRTPSTPLQAEQDVEGDGYGVVCQYGDHFKTPEEGQGLVQVRAEEILSRKATYQGEGDCQGFASGHLFQLDEHFNSAMNQEYVLTAVRHSGAQASSEATGFGEGEDGQATSYRNEFQAIPKPVAYRPRRRTAKPKLYGVLNAQVDASGPGTRAEIDGEGRYKLVMPFDLSGTAEGKATRWVRMAQPYGGGQNGMHFPLLKGAEVLWTCIDGDPDRPIISGVVPNPLNKSVVNAESQTRNRIKTASGIMMEFQDGPGPAAKAASAAGEALSGQQQAQRIGATNARRAAAVDMAPEPLQPATAADRAEASDSVSRPLTQQQQHSVDYIEQEETDHDSTASTPEVKWFKVDVPDYDGRFAGNVPVGASTVAAKAYYRRGKHDPNESIEAQASSGQIKMNEGTEDEHTAKLELNKRNPKKGEARENDFVDHPLDGVLDYVDGNRTIITNGNVEEYVNGWYRKTIAKGGEDVYDAQKGYDVTWTDLGDGWHKYENQYVNSTTVSHGTTVDLFWGWNMDIEAGFDTNIFGGGRLNVEGPIVPTVNARLFSANVDVGYGWDFDYVAGEKYSESEAEDIKARNEIKIRVNGDDTTYKTWWGTKGILGILSGCVGAGIGAVMNPYDEEASEKRREHSVAHGAAVGAYAALAAAAIAHKLYDSRTTNANDTEVILDKNALKLACRGEGAIKGGGTGSRIEMTPDSITLRVGENRIVIGKDQINITGKNTDGNDVVVWSDSGIIHLQGGKGVSAMSDAGAQELV